MAPVTPPPDDAPISRNPRAPREKFASIKDAAEAALVDTRGQFRAPIPRRRLPRWARWVAVVAFIGAVVGWVLGIR